VIVVVVVVLLMVVDVDRSRADVRKKILFVRFARSLAWPCVFSIHFLGWQKFIWVGRRIGAKSGQPCYSPVMLMSEAKASSDRSGAI
jgi:hypothetical protein